MQLARIASFIGVKVTTSETGNADPRHQASAAGIPLIEGTLPNDPDIGFLDDSIGLGQGLKK